MKTSLQASLPRCGLWLRALIGCAAFFLPCINAPRVQAAEAVRTFANPQEAASGLAAAIKAQDAQALRAIFGPALEEIENPDRVQATNEFQTFAEALGENLRIARESETKSVLEIGTNYWPFPIPIVQRDGRWFFDTAAGLEELVNRRIGKNELATLEVMRAFVEAQREYASRDRDGDGVLEFAQRLSSSPGTQDGLYWPPELDGETSPLGPLVANAQLEGYRLGSRAGGSAPEPYHGYYFRILKRQGPHAAAGKYDHVINGHMIAGFALLAWPAEWGHSGVMTFIVNQEGKVYQKDLGPKTSRKASSIKTYDPDPIWRLSPN